MPERLRESVSEFLNSASFPKRQVGDIVLAQNYIGAYKVLSVSATGMAEIQSFQVSKQQVFGKVIANIPSGRLRPFLRDSR
jgi:hypothetical protein